MLLTEQQKERVIWLKEKGYKISDTEIKKRNGENVLVYLGCITDEGEVFLQYNTGDSEVIKMVLKLEIDSRSEDIPYIANKRDVAISSLDDRIDYLTWLKGKLINLTF